MCISPRLCFGSLHVFLQLLPLVQTGLGALGTADVELVRSGACVVLSRPHPQRPLFVTDYSRIKQQPGPRGVKIAYYYIMLFAEEIARAGGVDILVLVASDRKIPISLARRGWEMIFTGLPVKIKQMIVLQRHELGKERFLDSLAFSVSRATNYSTGLPNEQVAGDSTEENLKLLQSKGISREFVPSKYGGFYEYSQFHEFIRMRISVEDIM